MFKAEAQADRQPRPTIKWRIAHKLALASILMIMLTLLAGGVGLWQVLTIGQAIDDARQQEQQRARSLELLATGYRLIAALDSMILTQDPLLASTKLATSLGTLSFHVETLQGTSASSVEASGQEAGTSELLEEMQVVYDELRQVVDEVDLLARQERWVEASIVLEQKVKPVNERASLLIRRLVRQADQDAEATSLRAQAVIRQAALLLAALVVLTTAIALGWRRFVFRGLGLSINELRQGVTRISSGDLEYKLDVRTGDEIEELGAEFNKMADELANVIGSLEQRVAERTRGLQAAAEVARATTSVLDPDELLRQVVDLVHERFNLYYVGLFLLDQERRFAVLQTGTGEAGRQMITQGHRLEAGGESMIGQCVARSEARIALDVGEEAVRFDNPFLPDTHSELALPLRSHGRVIGAMTVQSVEEAAFDETDISVMQTMADQVAVAIDNARLFAEAQVALEAAEATHRRYLRQEWTAYLPTAETIRYETRRRGVAPLDDAVLPEIQQAVKQRGATVLTSDDDARRSHSALVAPITLRGGEVIGALGLHDDEARQWTDDEIALVEVIAQRLALAADNLRLLDQTQGRAAHEQLTREISDKMQQASDMGTLIQYAIQELQSTFGASYAVVHLGTEDELLARLDGDA
jgi:GAF domain-containing protein/HAMP domain-containing protein